MRILFVCSGNSGKFEISPIIKSQGDSLQKTGVDLEYFTIKGKGYKGYIKSIPILRKYLKYKKYDLIHAHYTLSGWVAILGNRKHPVICSFMGSDTFGDTNIYGKKKNFSYREIILAKLIQPLLSGIIVKSENLYKYIWLKRKATIIPNGVNLSIFQEKDKAVCRKELGLDQSKKYILFLGNKSNSNKNFFLLENALQILKSDNAEILNPYPVHHSKIHLYLNATDVLVLTSYLEGSPNVIKEAMACNCPIVSTDVGDVKWVIGDTEGCHITPYKMEDVAEKIELALKFEKRTNGRDRIIELGLEENEVAKQIIRMYYLIL